MFRIGQKVVCVDDSPAPDGYPVCVKRGRVYTVAGIGKPGRSGILGLYIEGIRFPGRPGFRPDGFRASRFRPVVEHKTDISIFTAMLTDTKQPVGAD